MEKRLAHIEAELQITLDLLLATAVASPAAPAIADAFAQRLGQTLHRAIGEGRDESMLSWLEQLGAEVLGEIRGGSARLLR